MKQTSLITLLALFGSSSAINIKSEEQLSKTVHKKKELLEIDLSQS